MAKSKAEKVKIPMSLMEKVICMLVNLTPDLDEYGPVLVQDHRDIVLALKNLKKSIELRDDYSRFIHDTAHDMRWESHMEYAQYRIDEADLPF